MPNTLLKLCEHTRALHDELSGLPNRYDRIIFGNASRFSGAPEDFLERQKATQNKPAPETLKRLNELALEKPSGVSPARTLARKAVFLHRIKRSREIAHSMVKQGFYIDGADYGRSRETYVLTGASLTNGSLSFDSDINTITIHSSDKKKLDKLRGELEKLGVAAGRRGRESITRLEISGDHAKTPGVWEVISKQLGSAIGNPHRRMN